MANYQVAPKGELGVRGPGVNLPRRTGARVAYLYFYGMLPYTLKDIYTKGGSISKEADIFIV